MIGDFVHRTRGKGDLDRTEREQRVPDKCKGKCTYQLSKLLLGDQKSTACNMVQGYGCEMRRKNNVCTGVDQVIQDARNTILERGQVSMSETVALG